MVQRVMNYTLSSEGLLSFDVVEMLEFQSGSFEYNFFFHDPLKTTEIASSLLSKFFPKCDKTKHLSKTSDVLSRLVHKTAIIASLTVVFRIEM